VPPTPLNDDALGRALDTLDDAGVTELDSRMAATAAPRLGLAARGAPRDRTRGPVDGCSTRAEEPAAHGMPITRGARRAQRPDLHHVRLDVVVAHQAGSAVRRTPRRDHRRDGQAFGQRIPDPRMPWPIPDGTPYLGAERALSRAEHRPQLAATRTPWITRVPATLRAAPAVWAPATP